MNTNKKLLFKNDARKEILVGVEILSNAVRCTLGPKGRTVVIERPGQAPHITKDGITVAKSINLKNQFYNLGAQMIKEVASQTVDVVGDGTTTATILACDIYREGLKKVLNDDFSPVEIKRGIDFAVESICTSLDEMTKPIETREDIIHIGTVSSNGDRNVGNMLADAMDRVGRDGVITVEEAKGYETKLEVVEGMRFNRGYTSPYFVTNTEKMECVLENPYILISNNKFDQLKDLISLLEQVMKTERPILIIADEIGGEAMHGLTVNHQKNIIKTCAIRAPEFGASRHGALEDIAILTNGKIVSQAGGISVNDINLADHDEKRILGTCKRAIIAKGHCTLVSGNDRQEQIDKRIHELETQLEDPTISDNQTSVLQRRLARLSGGIGIIRVGGSTEVEMREYKDRIDDALCATQAAVESGLVPGGGIALVKAASDLKTPDNQTEDFKSGVDIVRDACFAPLIQIIENAGGEKENILSRITTNQNPGEGWNAATGKFCNMIENGIIDPLKVPKTALRNAASVAGLMLTVDCAIVEEDMDLLANAFQMPEE